MSDAMTPALVPDHSRFTQNSLQGRLAPLTNIMRQPAVRRAMPALAGLAAITLVAGTYFALQSPGQAPLYAGLADADKAAIGEALQTAGIAFAIDPQSGTLTVDASQVHEARIALAGQGLPKAQPSGGSALVELPMGASRAVEGETLRTVREADLARTIEAIDAVRSAKVHIGTPEPSPFVRDKAVTTASVMLTLENGRTLSDGQVQAIRFMLASSVPGLQADQVSVIDQRGTLLSETLGSGDLKMFQLQSRVEDRLRATLDRLLLPMLGTGNFSVEVSADVDRSESQATRETYPENDRALRSEQVTRSTSGQVIAPASGIPGALSNLPPEQAAVTQNPPGGAAVTSPREQQSNENSARAFDVGREISVTHEPQGRIRRISVAVALHQGKKAFTQADLAKFDGLVKGAVGFDATRGDLVAISQRPFVKEADTPVPLWAQPWFVPTLQQVGALLAAALAFLFIGRPMIRNARARAARQAETEEMIREELSAQAPRGSARGSPVPGDPITLEMIETAPSYDARAALVRNFVRQDPQRAAAVVRRMLQEGASA